LSKNGLSKVEYFVGSYNLTCVARKAVFVFATFCFVAMVTGASAQLHLWGHEDPNGHDSNNCSICRQLMAPSKFAAAPELELDDVRPFKGFVKFVPRMCVTISHREPFNPRPPPSAL
jgi:hypothetical protein